MRRKCTLSQSEAHAFLTRGEIAFACRVSLPMPALGLWVLSVSLCAGFETLLNALRFSLSRKCFKYELPAVRRYYVQAHHSPVPQAATSRGNPIESIPSAMASKVRKPLSNSSWLSTTRVVDRVDFIGYYHRTINQAIALKALRCSTLMTRSVLVSTRCGATLGVRSLVSREMTTSYLRTT